jgi:hypothetical protein
VSTHSKADIIGGDDVKDDKSVLVEQALPSRSGQACSSKVGKPLTMANVVDD